MIESSISLTPLLWLLQVTSLEQAAAEAATREQAAVAAMQTMMTAVAELREQQETLYKAAHTDRIEAENQLRQQVDGRSLWAVNGTRLPGRAVWHRLLVASGEAATALPFGRGSWCSWVQCFLLAGLLGLTLTAASCVLLQMDALTRAMQETSGREEAARSECWSLESTVAELKQQLEAMREAAEAERRELEERMNERVSGRGMGQRKAFRPHVPARWLSRRSSVPKRKSYYLALPAQVDALSAMLVPRCQQEQAAPCLPFAVSTA